MMIKHGRLLAAVLFSSASGGCSSTVPASSDPTWEADVRIDRLEELAWLELRPGLRVKAIIGQSSTIALAEFDHDVTVAAHHHAHEQFNVGISGSLDILIGDRSRPLVPGVATLAPANVQHALSNLTVSAGQMIEFQPVRRVDLVLPRQQVSFPRSPTPAQVPPTLDIETAFHLTAPGWSNAPGGHLVKALLGQGSALRFWQLVPTARSPAQLRSQATGGEQIVFVVSGSCEIVWGRMRRTVGPGAVIQIPAQASDIRIRPVDGQPTLLLDFHAASGVPPL